MKSASLLLGICLLFTCRSASGQAALRRIPLPGDGSWDYLTVDAIGRRLYVAHEVCVHVLDLDRQQAVGEIAPTPGVHGIAVVPDLGLGFTTDGADATVTVFDLKTLAVVRTLKVEGAKPDGILYEPFTRRLFTFDGDSDNTCAFDAASGRTLGTLDLGGAPEAAASDGAGAVFVNLEDRAEVVRFDPAALAITARWPLAPAHTPTALALDRANHRLLSCCRSRNLVVLDSDTGARVADLPIGAGVDSIALDALHHRAFVSCGDGTVTVIKWDASTHYRVAGTITTQPGAKTLAYDPEGQRLYLSAAQFGPTPPPTAGQPKPRRAILPGTFAVLVIDVPAETAP